METQLLPDMEGLKRTIAELGGTLLDSRLKADDPDVWVVMWSRERDASYATHRVHRSQPTTVEDGCYGFKTFEKAQESMLRRSGRLSPVTLKEVQP